MRLNPHRLNQQNRLNQRATRQPRRIANSVSTNANTIQIHKKNHPEIEMVFFMDFFWSTKENS